MITTAKIVDYDGDCLTIRPDGHIDTELLHKSVDKVEIRLVDGRTITAEQRKKAYALINDIAKWSGHLPEEIKAYSKAGYCAESGEEDFSLGSCTVTTAREYITYLIDFCLRNEVPCMDLPFKPAPRDHPLGSLPQKRTADYRYSDPAHRHTQKY